MGTSGTGKQKADATAAALDFEDANGLVKLFQELGQTFSGALGELAPGLNTSFATAGAALATALPQLSAMPECAKLLVPLLAIPVFVKLRARARKEERESDADHDELKRRLTEVLEQLESLSKKTDSNEWRQRTDEKIAALYEYKASESDVNAQFDNVYSKLQGQGATIGELRALLLKAGDAEPGTDFLASLVTLSTDIVALRTEVQEGFAAVEGHFDAVKAKLDTHQQDLHRPKLSPIGALVRIKGSYRFDQERHTFRGRQMELAALKRFANDDRAVLWQLVVGPAGSGKSRLALQFVRTLGTSAKSEQDGWDAGFVNWRVDQPTSLDLWEPRRNTLVVLDYAASHAEQIGAWISACSESSTLRAANQVKLRFLLMERMADSVFRERLYGDGHQAEILKKGVMYSDPIELTDLDREATWGIVEQVFSDLNVPLDPSKRYGIEAALASVNPNGRPLFSAFAADALARGHNIAQWNEEDTAEYIISAERAKVRDPFLNQSTNRTLSDGVRNRILRHEHLMCAATIAGGVPMPGGYESLYSSLVENGLGAFVPSASDHDFDERLYKRLVALGGSQVEGWLSQLEPDYVGELYVAELLHELANDVSEAKSRELAAAFVKTGLRLNETGTVVELGRVAQDFPSHESTRLLLRSIPDTATFAKVLNQAGSLTTAELIASTMDDAKVKKNVVIYTTIMKYGDLATAERLFQEMREAGVEPNVVTFNTLLNLKPTYQQGLELLGTMREAGVEPNVVTFSTLHNLKPTYQQGLELLGTMREAGVEPNVVTFSTLLNLKPTYQQGLELLGTMREAGVEPNVVTFSTLLNLKPTYQQGLELLGTMREAGVEPNVVTFSTLLNLKPTYQQGLELLGTMREAGVEPNVVTFNTLLNLKPTYQQGLELLGTMREAGVEPNVVTFSTLLNLKPTYQQGLELLGTMREAGVEPNVVTFSTLLNLKPTYQQGLELLGTMREAGVEPNVVTFNTLLNLKPTYQQGLELLGTMREAGVEPDVVTFNTLLNLKPTYQQGLELLETMKAAGVDPDVFTFTTLLKCCTRTEEAKAILLMMRSRGIEPNEVTWKSCRRFGIGPET